MIKTVEECKLIKKCAYFDIAEPDHKNNRCLGYAKGDNDKPCRRCRKCMLHTYKLDDKD